MEDFFFLFFVAFSECLNFNHTLTQVYNDKNLIKARIQVVASCANSRKSRDSFQLCMDANLRLKAQGAPGKIELCST